MSDSSTSEIPKLNHDVASVEPVSEQAEIKYDEVQTVVREFESIEDIDFFISHATDGEGASPEEKSFVSNVVTKLISDYGVRVFIDHDDIVGTITGGIEDGLKRSKFIIVICSPRYQVRYLPPVSTVKQELSAFSRKEEITQKFKIIPVLLGISRERFETLIAPLMAKRESILAQKPNETEIIDIDLNVSKIIAIAEKFSGNNWQPFRKPQKF